MFSQPAKFSAVITKRVDCEKCGARYLYELSRAATAHSYVLMFAALVLLPLAPLALLSSVTGWVVFVVPAVAFVIMVLVGLRSTAAEGTPMPLPGVSAAVDSSAQNEAGLALSAKLRRALEHAVEPVPCPECGWYQRDMVAEARSRVFPWFDQAALIVVLLIQAVAVAVIKQRHLTETGDMLKLWGICTGIGLAFAGFAFCARWLYAFSYDPNQGYPASRPPYPDSPPAVREADYLAKIAAETARITAAVPHLPRGKTIISIREIKLLPPATGN